MNGFVNHVFHSLNIWNSGVFVNAILCKIEGSNKVERFVEIDIQDKAVSVSPLSEGKCLSSRQRQVVTMTYQEEESEDELWQAHGGLLREVHLTIERKQILYTACCILQLVIKQVPKALSSA